MLKTLPFYWKRGIDTTYSINKAGGRKIIVTQEGEDNTIDVFIEFYTKQGNIKEKSHNVKNETKSDDYAQPHQNKPTTQKGHHTTHLYKRKSAITFAFS